MKPLDCIAKRDLLAAKKFNPEEIRAYADDFMAEERHGDAFDYYRKLDDSSSVRRVKDAAVRISDTQLLWRIEHADREAVTRDDWIACGDNAMRDGKFRTAAYAFKRVGDDERLARAEKEFKSPSEEPEAEVETE